MATKPQDIEKLLQKHLGKEAAAAMMAKIDRMVKQGKSAAAIEKVIFSDLRKYIEQQVAGAIASLPKHPPIPTRKR